MGDESDVLFCRICLRINLTKKYILSDNAQKKFIEKFFKENGYFKDFDDHSYACFECRSVLHRSYNFIQKALQAQKVLYELQEKQEPLTYSMLQNLDREKYHITSNLVCRKTETYAIQPLETKLRENLSVESLPDKFQNDNFSSRVDITVDQNETDVRNIMKLQENCSLKSVPIEPQDDNLSNSVNLNVGENERNILQSPDTIKIKDSVKSVPIELHDDNISNSGEIPNHNKPYIIPTVDYIKPKENVPVKSKSSETQGDNCNSMSSKDIQLWMPLKLQPDAGDNLNSSIDPSSDLNKPKIEGVKKNEGYIKSYTKTIVDVKFEPKVDNNSHADPFCYGNVKPEPEIHILTEDNYFDEQYEHLEVFDPLDSKNKDNTKSESSDVYIVSSDDKCTHLISSDDNNSHEKVRKRKRKRKNRIKKKGIKKRKITLNVFSSDEEGKKKKKRKFVWPAMPIFEERFRTRKDMNYSALIGGNEEEEIKVRKNVKKKPDDDEFVPASENSSDDSADESGDNYDDHGKLIRRKKDTREFPMECEECSAIVTSKRDHQYHYFHMHRDIQYPYREKEERILCTLCGESVSKKRMQLHEDKHAGKKCECDICHKKFSNRPIMLKHRKNVHNNHMLTPRVCDYCGMSFFTKSDIIRHIRTHTGEKPFKCHLCEYRAATKGNIIVHIKQFHQKIYISKETPKKLKKSGNKKNKSKRISEENEEDFEENIEKEDRSKRKIKGTGKKKRKRRRKVATDSDTE